MPDGEELRELEKCLEAAKEVASKGEKLSHNHYPCHRVATLSISYNPLSPDIVAITLGEERVLMQRRYWQALVTDAQKPLATE